MSTTPAEARRGDRPAYGAFRHPKDFPQEIDPVAAYVDVLKTSPHVVRLILFGSRAIGDHYPRSDVDMAVMLDTEDRAAWHEVLDSAERAETLISIDLVRYADASGAFRDAIDRHGKVVYERA